MTDNYKKFVEHVKSWDSAGIAWGMNDLRYLAKKYDIHAPKDVIERIGGINKMKGKTHKHKGISGYHPMVQKHSNAQAQKFHDLELNHVPTPTKKQAGVQKTKPTPVENKTETMLEQLPEPEGFFRVVENPKPTDTGIFVVRMNKAILQNMLVQFEGSDRLWELGIAIKKVE